jgi:CRP-like cAMP-binding protein
VINAKTAKAASRKKKNKKKGYHKDIGEDYTIHENFTIIPKQATAKDVKLIINSLLSHFFFKTLSNEEIENVITKMFYGVVDKDQYVFRQGDQASCFFIVHEGSVSVEIKKAEGVQKVKELDKGEYFGELALMYNSTRSASIKANSKTKLWAIDRHTFKKVVEEGPTKNFKENREFIEKVSFFDSMTDSQKDAVTMALLMQAFNKGEIIINEGDQAASYYIIKEVGGADTGRGRMCDGRPGGS